MRPVFYERKFRPYHKFNGRFLWRLLLLILAVVVGNAVWKFGEKQVSHFQSVKQTAEAEALLRDHATRDFAELAFERSLDETSARGGLLAPIARRDPSYPETLRAAIFATEVGKTSAPVLDGSKFYVVEIIAEKPADATTREVARARCARTLRLSRERLLMDALARELASSEGVTVFDRAFD